MSKLNRRTIVKAGLSALAAPGGIDTREWVARLRGEEHQPDVIIIDTESPSRDTLEHVAMLSERFGVTYLCFEVNFGALPHAEVMESMERFAATVMRHFA
jgi:AmiR/NasT family two-component response regulator